MSTGTGYPTQPRPTRIDKRRNLIVPGSKRDTLVFCLEHFVNCAKEAIEKRGRFAVALSGGSTPQALFQLLSSPTHINRLDWSKVWLFWGDERAVPPEHEDSNYGAAMSSGLQLLPLCFDQVFHMKAESHIDRHAQDYEKALRQHLPDGKFDLVMLGMGEDGHTASLFPGSEGLHETHHWVIPNYIPSKDCWRMTLTYPALHQTRNLCFYVLGKGKKEMLHQVLSQKENGLEWPSQKVGTEEVPALWIADSDAAEGIF